MFVQKLCFYNMKLTCIDDAILRAINLDETAAVDALKVKKNHIGGYKVVIESDRQEIQTMLAVAKGTLESWNIKFKEMLERKAKEYALSRSGPGGPGGARG